MVGAGIQAVWEQVLDGMRGDELAGLDFSGGGFGQYRFSMNSKRLYDGVELAATGESCPLPGGLTYTSQDIAMGNVVLDQNWSYLECEFISHDGGKYNVLQLFEKHFKYEIVEWLMFFGT